MGTTPYLPGQSLTASMLRFPAMYQQALSGGPTSGTTRLALGTLVVPAFAVPTLQYPSAFWTGDGSLEGERILFGIHDDSITDPRRGALTNHTPYSSTAAMFAVGFAIVHANAKAVPAGDDATYVAAVENLTGVGTITTLGTTARLSVLVLPDFS